MIELFILYMGLVLAMISILFYVRSLEKKIKKVKRDLEKIHIELKEESLEQLKLVSETLDTNQFLTEQMIELLRRKINE